jgi:hypothetical protein
MNFPRVDSSDPSYSSEEFRLPPGFWDQVIVPSAAVEVRAPLSFAERLRERQGELEEEIERTRTVSVMTNARREKCKELQQRIGDVEKMIQFPVCSTCSHESDLWSYIPMESGQYISSLKEHINHINNMRCLYNLAVAVQRGVSVSFLGGQWIELSLAKGAASIDDLAERFYRISSMPQKECEHTRGHKQLVSERICRLYSIQESKRNEKWLITKTFLFVRNIFYYYSTTFPPEDQSVDLVLRGSCTSLVEYRFRQEFGNLTKKSVG